MKDQRMVGIEEEEIQLTGAKKKFQKNHKIKVF